LCVALTCYGGGDIHQFHPPRGMFAGVIGGPPCQAHVRYAKLNASIGNKVAPDLIPEFVRVVKEALPDWFLMENSSLAPDIKVEAYVVQVEILSAVLFGLEQNRKRKFQFGSRTGIRIRPQVESILPAVVEKACLASEGRSGVIVNFKTNGKQKSFYQPRRPWARFCELQGLPSDFLTDAPLTNEGKYKVVGNGVPIPMGFALAKAINAATE
jgi:DNA (cytosine-5)-methyltransferase 1